MSYSDPVTGYKIHDQHVKNATKRLSEWAMRVRTGAHLAVFSLFAVLVYWVTVFLMHLGSGWTLESQRFSGTVEFEAWTELLGVNVAVWIMIAIWLWRQGMVWKRERDHIGVVVPALIYFALAGFVYQGLAQAQSHVPIPLYLGNQRTHLVTRLHELKEKISQGRELPSGDEIVSTLRECRLNLLHCVAGVGAIITGAVLAVAALRAAIHAAGLPVSRYPFPATWLLFLGAYFTAVLALIAVPAFISWRSLAMAYVARIYAVPADGRLPENWAAGRSGLKRLLHVERVPIEVAANLLGLLAPLLTAILGAFVSAG